MHEIYAMPQNGDPERADGPWAPLLTDLNKEDIPIGGSGSRSSRRLPLVSRRGIRKSDTHERRRNAPNNSSGNHIRQLPSTNDVVRS